MKQKKEKSGSVKIDPKVLDTAKKYCKDNGVVLGYFVTCAVREKMINQSVVPQKD